MMLIDTQKLKGIYLVCGKTDLRRGIDGLARVITEQYELDPYSQALFMFCGTRKDRYKALYWDGDGFILLYKRYESGHLRWPRNTTEVRQLSLQQLEWLLAGLAIDPTVHKVGGGHLY